VFSRWAIEVSGIVVWACGWLGNRNLPGSSFRRLAKIPQWNLDICSRLHYHYPWLSFAESRTRQGKSLTAIKPRQHTSYEDT
jgi:hypothetical protein